MDRAARIAELRRQLIIQAWMPWIITSIIVGILIYVASAVGLWKMFEKAGEKNWKAWIPVYNTYILCKICWKTKWFWPALGGYVFIAVFGNLRVGNPLATVFAVIIVLVLIALFVWKCFFSYFIAKKFNKSKGWVVGLIFLDWLFYILLGWGSAKYADAKPKSEPEKDEKVDQKTKVAPKKTTAAKAKKPTPRKASSSKPNAAKKDVEKPKEAEKKEEKKTDYIDPKPKINF